MHAAGQGEIRLVPLEARHRLMDRDQGRRAGGIQRQCRPFQAERERDAADRGVERGAGDGIEAGGGLVGPGILQDQPAILVVADPGVDAGAAAFQAVRVHAGVFQRAPASFQHHPLLRIEELRLHRRDAEERGVEPVEFVEIGAEPAGRCPAGALGEQLADAADARAGRPFDHPALSRLQHAPERGQTLRSRKAAGHAHNRDGPSLLGAVDRPVQFVHRDTPWVGVR